MDIDYSKCLKYTYNKYRDTYVVSGVNGKAMVDGKVVIPETYKGKTVSDIERYAFENCKELKTIVLSDEIRTLQTCAFSGCVNLSEVVFGKNLWQVRFAVFKNCTSLKELILPDSVEEFISPLEGCTSLKKLVLSDNLKKFTESEGCTALEYNVYADCKYLGTVTNPYFCLVEALVDGRNFFVNADTKMIARFAFTEDEEGELTPFTVYLPEGLISIDCTSFCAKSINAFDIENGRYFKTVDGCIYSRDGEVLICYPRAKTDVTFTLPKYVTKIGDSAIHGNPFLEKLDLSGVSTIGKAGVSYCKNLTEIVCGEDLTFIDERAFTNDVSINEIELCEGVYSIGASAFENCVSLQKVILPQTLRYVGDGAFYNANELYWLQFKNPTQWRFLTKKEAEFIESKNDKLAKKWNAKLNEIIVDSGRMARLMTGELCFLELAKTDYKKSVDEKTIKL